MILEFQQCVVTVYGCLAPDRYTPMLGTGFRLGRPDVVVTAKHVVDQGYRQYAVAAKKANVVQIQLTRVVEFPDAPADLAVLLLDGVSNPWQCFRLLEHGDGKDALGESVASFGFPVHESDSFTARFMVGNIQRQYQHQDDEREESYFAYELGFPAFPGQSGSPVVLHGNTAAVHLNALAVVTNSVAYFDHPSAASWAIGLSLAPFGDWLSSFVPSNSRTPFSS